MLDIGSDKQLFIGPWDSGRDSYLVESMSNVTMRMGEAQPTGERILSYDKPWESAGNPDVFQYPMGSVIHDGSMFRMYYAAFPKYPWNAHFTCYAESADGINWNKPNVGAFTWEGSQANNIILPNDSFPERVTDAHTPTVFIDANAQGPSEKYKLITLVDYDADAFTQIATQYGAALLPDVVRGQYTLYSADGIQWHYLSDGPVNHGLDDTQFSAFWDDRINKYVIYTRTKPRISGAATYYKQYQQNEFGVQREDDFYDHVHEVSRTNLGSMICERRGGRAESEDFVTFGPETEVIKTDSLDHRDAPAGCPSALDFHGPNVVKYSEAPNVYIAMPDAIHHTHFDWFTGYDVKYWEGPRYLPMTVDALLMTSRDGIAWNRTPQRNAFIPRIADTYWSKQVYPRSIVRVGDELWVYFIGLEVARNLDQDRKIQDVLGRDAPHKGAWGRAIIRLDGFISADTTGTQGELVTKPLTFKGGELQLNVDTGSFGSVKVEIQDATGNPLKGFTEADADIIHVDSVQAKVSWKGSTDVSALAGQTVRLRFVMADAKIYAFQFIA